MAVDDEPARRRIGGVSALALTHADFVLVGRPLCGYHVVLAGTMDTGKSHDVCCSETAWQET